MKKITVFCLILMILIGCSGCELLLTPDTGEVVASQGGENVEAPSSEASSPEETEPTEPTNNDRYDFGVVLENPTDADIELFYEMVKSLCLPWRSFEAETAEIPFLMDIILNDVGDGLFHQYEFSFYEETVELGGEMQIYSRYYAEDIDWVLKAVFGREPDHGQMVGELGDKYFEDEYFYRYACENYMGNPVTDVLGITPKYEILENGNWRFIIRLVTQYEFDVFPTDYFYGIEAIPMKSKDVGTYWRILSVDENPYD